ncbi:Signal transduction histidine kinase [Marininema halotolerans]|uniref:histidine kinase n=2 Tax=Marininema halotolerans TaxID=1155944 RepID=A0A1I6SKC6_9BACL|nr:Signal transduction histidine kinase [Marininema halotolerans]
MKLFWREHFSFLLVNLFQLFLVILVYWLDGNHRSTTAIYAGFLGIFILVMYLVIRYVIHRSFYLQLSHPTNSLDETIHTKGLSPLSLAIQGYLSSQYRHYQATVHQYEMKQQQHLTFITQWVHQMKTPLSVIQLTMKGKIEPIFQSIQEEISRIRTGLETVLYTARLEAFEHDFSVQRVSLQSVINEVVFEHKRSFIRHKVFPQITVDETIHVETDPKWLSFIVGQLIGNAIRYSAEMSETLSISAFLKEDMWVLEISDEGIGIPAQDIHRVCEPYFTGENGRKYRESTGMGLYLVQEVCKKLHHQFEISSEEGRGTTVRILFFHAR